MEPQLSQPRQTGSDRLGRYYTAASVGTALVAELNSFTPGRVIDLGAGGGSLSLAAALRWRDSEILTVDVDSRSRAAFRTIPSVLNRHLHVRADALRANLPSRIQTLAGKVDAGVCNPPFIAPRWRNEYLDILNEAGFTALPSVSRDIEAPAIFLAQNMRILADEGFLGIILPDSLISSMRYRWFREALLENYAVEQVIKLPRASFKGTDALAHAVILHKSNQRQTTVQLGRFTGSAFEVVHAVSTSDAIDRLDVDYHLTLSGVSSQRTISGVGGDVRRGSFERAVSAARGIAAMHTTDFGGEDLGHWIDIGRRFAPKRSHEGSSIVAERGDILIARVGRNFDSKIIGIRSGSAVFTDCVYRLRVPSRERAALLEALASPSGRAWLRAQAYGVSATQLTKASLLKFSY